MPPTVNFCGDDTYARPRTLFGRAMHVNKCAKQNLLNSDSRLNTCHNNYIMEIINNNGSNSSNMFQC